ncbi:MAG: hypothetical protein NZ902_01790 [Acidilobaceae archaeon]|nr:hypothetical protein [Acidilobaceae archaeon]MDW7973984.1 V-type ATP synthase subunit K [Sulfolobales archaeon]
MKAQSVGIMGPALLLMGLLISVSAGGLLVIAQETSETVGKAIGAAIAVGVAGLGAGFAVGIGGAAVASAIVERREASGILLLIVILGEGIAIYGLLIALLIMLLL